MEIKTPGFYKTRNGLLAKVQAVANGIATGWVQRREGDGGKYAMAWRLDGSWAMRGSIQKSAQNVYDLIEYVGPLDDWPIDRECDV